MGASTGRHGFEAAPRAFVSRLEVTIRVMSRWNREGLLLTGRERFVIPDREKFRTEAQVGEDE